MPSPGPASSQQETGSSLGKRKRDTCSCKDLAVSPLSALTFDSVIRVTIGTGASKEDFYIHKSLLTHHSTYFKAALNGNFKESADGAVSLPEDDPEVFQAFCCWLYARQLWAPSTNTETKKVPLNWNLLCKIFVFGDARGILGLRNAAIDALIDKTGDEWIIMTTEINYIYQNTPKSSLLRKLALDMVSKVLLMEKLEEENCNMEFMMDLAKALGNERENQRKRLSKDVWRRTNKCEYHDQSEVAPTPNQDPK